ncbi:MAG: deoxyguanosinetriphosphate triphosphohydrolase [Chloroflexi bacterium AL-W]|nr:deoxyguanosinetriphosphate triphosphohydrolase [Chloroflexi bacterium AL-N1]NOK66189.1 deoxyguanosinetriphosphate triphosphohydrolase [Chloroflexi bacterium AL-N10]NOK73070.1 deoxyguanosinetriphosphate triphosphohydrolase [Chloroflexi bacterium AL-N5]NOK79967.1 deoxyguanosinetriphosphate triphosphohydrolase [Chloroflexi bacterium AL-W]NOK88177.1 deoxyguanosinetriphosphate triphosphohydrolase [Chloroflexi bacterium AL-N15]
MSGHTPAHSSVREWLETQEHTLLSSFATLSDAVQRDRPEPESPVRTRFQRDRDRILHSKPFRRLKHKTQVFIAPTGDHYRTRLTHTLEVTQIARTVARALRLNEDLVEAIGLGHDLGHTPFGHAGETALSKVLGHSFRHNEQSLRIVEVLEKQGRGLNLTYPVREGIFMHSKGRRGITAKAWGTASTLEGQIIKIADSIAYINHDIDDAIRAGVLDRGDLPCEPIEILGATHSQRINTMVCDLIDYNWWITGDGTPPDPLELSLSPPILASTNALREFMYQNVYLDSKAKLDDGKVKVMIEMLFRHFLEHPEELPADLQQINRDRGEPITRAVIDYIAGMTDRYAIETFKKLYVPTTWNG